jgi:hypothetical protein
LFLFLIPAAPLIFIVIGFAVGAISKEDTSKNSKYFLFLTSTIVAAYLVALVVSLFLVLSSSDPYIVVIWPAMSVLFVPFVPFLLIALLHVGGAFGTHCRNRYRNRGGDDESAGFERKH